jgi:hypothetical protein
VAATGEHGQCNEDGETKLHYGEILKRQSGPRS